VPHYDTRTAMTRYRCRWGFCVEFTVITVLFRGFFSKRRHNEPAIAAEMARSFYHLLLTGMPFNSISTGGIGTPCRMFNIVVVHCIGGTASLIATAQVKKLRVEISVASSITDVASGDRNNYQ